MASALIGDIGATNARFAIVQDGRISAIRVLEVDDHPTLRDAIQAYLDTLQASEIPRPDHGALAVAGPVTGDFLKFTNHPWSFSIAALTRDIGFERLDIINDFAALAMAVPHLGVDDRRQIGGGAAVGGAPIAIIGPGTGLGVSVLVPADDSPRPRWITIATEGGHVTLAPVTEREDAIVRWLHGTGRAHVSAETLICGQGLSTLYAALSALDGGKAEPLPPPEVTARGIQGRDPGAVEAISIFCALLGTVAGNLALTTGARGGVYIAGGIVPRLGDLFDRSEFRARFVAKGRMQSYLEPIPTYLITREFPAFIGLAAFINQT